MKRFFVETVSVTSVVKKEESVTMDYHDLVTEKSEEKV